MNKISTEEIQYRLLNILESEPRIMQRDMAARMGVCLGRTNYCVNELVAKGWVQIQKIKRSKAKKAFLYQLTPAGLEAKARLTLRFLKAKLTEYDAIQAQIKALYHDAARQGLVDDHAELTAAVQRMP